MLCTVFDFGDYSIDICLFVLYCVVCFVCVLCAFTDKFQVQLLYDRICGPTNWYVRMYVCIYVCMYVCMYVCGGPGSVVSKATGYGVDGPGIESRWERGFPHLSRPSLGPTQPPVQWVLDLSRG